MRSVRLPIFVPHLVHNATESEIALRFRGLRLVARLREERGIRTVKLSVVLGHSVGEACCVNRLRSCDHKVPRRCARLTAVLRGSACPFFCSSSPSIELAGVRRCVGGQAPKLAGLHRNPSTSATTKGELRCQGAESASETARVWQSNYAFERPGSPFARARVRLSPYLAPSARLRTRRPAAQRQR
jgi:hypothetical protein